MFASPDQRPLGQSVHWFGADVNFPRGHVTETFMLHAVCFASCTQFVQPEEVRPLGHLTQ